MKVADLTAYEIIETRESEDLHSTTYLVKHKKTGAHISLISNDDENKVFYIGFRTPPKNSTGVAHILEHSVLCGSKNFPSKDPFVELAKGSLNTFLNAMTYPDKTVYPIASCNEKDFQNLMHVYLDAVFYPNIYREDKIFRQEGWHFEMEDEKDELTINGVVYNEMKGAFSSPDDLLDREVFNSLFPTTTYGFESGGHPDCIPDLSYEEFIAFHKKFYHPSNCYIYLYGDMDMAEKLEWIDKEYLDNFSEITVDSQIEMQPAFTEPVFTQKEYSITEAESLEDNTYLAYNTVIGTALDKELYVAFQVLDYALCSAPGAPLKQAIIDKGIGKDVYSVYENGILQPYFSIVAKSANQEQKDLFIQTIEEVLSKIVQEGFDKRSLKAGLNYFEFKYREGDYGSYPKGLMLGLQTLDSWLYDETKPFMHIEANDTFAKLKDNMNGTYFEQLIQSYLLSNKHKSIVLVTPVKGLTTLQDKKLQEKLALYKSTLSEEEISKIVQDTKDLLTYQEEPSKKEDLEKIPILKREDMKKEAMGFENQLMNVGDTDLLFHDIYTNGIAYVKLLFFINEIPKNLLPYLGLLKSLLGFMDTQNFDYADLFNEINIQTGGIAASVNTYTDALDLESYRFTFEMKTKTLYQNLPIAFSLMEEIIFTTKVEDTKRLLEIISELKSRMQASMTSAGHSLAAVRAMSYFSEAAAISEQTVGIPFYRNLEKWESDFDSYKDEIIASLKELMVYIFRPENLFVDMTATKEGIEGIDVLIKNTKSKLYQNPVEKQKLVLLPEKKNEGFTTSSQVQYVCRAGNFIQHGYVYTGALRVLKVIMGYEYLWNNVRVKGGAYGCMSSFGKTGDAYFVSYRDPNLERTIKVYEEASQFIKGFDADERTITKFIIGAISELDTPMNPSGKGARSLAAYLSKVTKEDIQRERDELLSVTVEILNGLAGYIDAFMSDECICVVGNEAKVKENGELFESVDNLFH